MSDSSPDPVPTGPPTAPPGRDRQGAPAASTGGTRRGAPDGAGRPDGARGRAQRGVADAALPTDAAADRAPQGAPGADLPPDAALSPDAIVTLTGRLAPRSGWQATRCTIAKAIDLVSNRSSFLLMREAFYGTTRFDDFAQRVGVSESVAAARLRGLVEQGLLERRPYREPGERTRFDYHLTEMGADFFPVLVALMQWGERWRGPARVGLRHHDCGAEVRAELHCADGHALTVREVDLVANETPASEASASEASAEVG